MIIEVWNFKRMAPITGSHIRTMIWKARHSSYISIFNQFTWNMSSKTVCLGNRHWNWKGSQYNHILILKLCFIIVWYIINVTPMRFIICICKNYCFEQRVANSVTMHRFHEIFKQMQHSAKNSIHPETLHSFCIWFLSLFIETGSGINIKTPIKPVPNLRLLLGYCWKNCPTAQDF